ncbi:MAG TPA: gene transfer agent family protein [Caulobacterales bacterium]|nr:gene transfer agent family protein [Caulobacterales bacterium]
MNGAGLSSPALEAALESLRNAPPTPPLIAPFADGKYAFKLAIGELRGLQNKLDSGPQQIVRRFADGSWRIDDIVETIRWGLIGGGAISLEDIRRLITDFIEARPLLENLPLAQAILLHALTGPPGEQSKKKQNRKARRMSASTSRKSTPPAPSLDGTPASSID